MPDSDGSTTGTTGTSDTTGDPPPPIGSWQEYLIAECTALLECGCTAPKGLGTSLEVCMVIRTAELGDIADQGLTWDPDCAAVRVAGIVQQCAADVASCATTTCNLFHGTAAHGQPCTASWSATHWQDASTCAAGLECSGKVCITPCSGEFGCDGNICGPGEGCFYDDGDIGYCDNDAGAGLYCDPIFGPDCGPGLVCVSDDIGWKCILPPAECEACTSICASGTYCDPATQLCRARGPVGAPCALNAACQSLSCGMGGQCDPPPGEGEPCPVAPQQCAPGLRCSSTMVCEPSLCGYL